MEDDDSSFLSRLEQTEWLKWIGALIRSAIRIVDLMDQQKTSVMIHCSDGWDRTLNYRLCPKYVWIRIYEL